ncbi:MFS transporter [Streptomyces sp. ISL-11]|uniref:MFS transporter n=1 Tax=Streptomyces sp. ISL-11 TaxID=2819174 RepID=UPI001BEAAB30|nr:MFS transporter [Streptomyces sp. ISL-11]MBT2382973.1 MFS transporter [Streptomyces sp. ISL-11]
MLTTGQSRLLLSILSLAAFMAGLDLFIVNVAFDDIGRDFQGESLSNLSWILNGYAIIFAALLVPLGRLADRYGRKEGFLLGVALFTLASGACAASNSLWMLVACRVLQAVGAAALTPASLGLLLSVFPPEGRPGAVRIWSASAALAAAAGPVFGGLLVSASWRWVFLVNLPVGLLTLVVAARKLPSSRDETPSRMPDLAGAGVLTVAVGLLSLGLVKIDDWSAVRVVLVVAVALLGIAGFWLRSRRHPSPVIEPTLLRVPVFAWSNATAVVFSAAFAANLLCAILWMQNVWGYSALRTGLGVAPGPLMVPLGAIAASKLARRVAPGRLVAAGCLLCVVGVTLMWRQLGQEAHYAGTLLPGWLVGGVGVGLALPTILSTATADLPQERFSTGSAVVNMSRQIGSVLGISLLVALLGTPRTYEQTHRAFGHAWIAIGVFMLLGAVTAVGMSPVPHRRTVPSRTPNSA